MTQKPDSRIRPWAGAAQGAVPLEPLCGLSLQSGLILRSEKQQVNTFSNNCAYPSISKTQSVQHVIDTEKLLRYFMFLLPH